MSSKIILPEATTPEPQPKFCPFLPPLVSQDQLTGKPALTFHACMGEGCAIYDRCQGDGSPMALNALVRGLIPASGPDN